MIVLSGSNYNIAQKFNVFPNTLSHKNEKKSKKMMSTTPKKCRRETFKQMKEFV